MVESLVEAAWEDITDSWCTRLSVVRRWSIAFCAQVGAPAFQRAKRSMAESFTAEEQAAINAKAEAVTNGLGTFESQLQQ